ncbi:isocitrate lyase/PEP mutase family protein [Halomonas sp. M5N1S17]|uniref:2,3-dimethylmalate lyase n=1 Tax=Halomonas chromatireducens TaxID=507626 RepID=A0A0X8HFD9_9GAMM|nr:MULTISPECIES: isocitrate lyase/PEP mutase family protein [Halomonas]AMD01565.1 2,3-dimethylmalate lyase [Halomonas chromatireducens]MCE9663677.1 isocitrate lyase/PEP mutase family protein [Halomonas alkalisoli]
MTAKTLKEQLNSGEIVVAPGIYDMISALIADRMGFKALYVTGYGTVASHLGLPDAGIATYSDMVSRIATMAKMTNTPIVADADTGYGGLLNVHHTVQGYEEAGASAIQLEDQEFPKKCGHTPDRRVIPLEDMVQKIKVACDARRSDDLVIIARTDSRTALGLDEALKRAQAYSEAGADAIFIESPESEQEMETIGKRIDKPLIANMVPGGRTPLLSADKLQSLGFALAIHPAAGFLATAAALEKSYTDLKENGGVTDSSLLYSFSEFNELIGFPEVWEFEKRYMG